MLSEADTSKSKEYLSCFLAGQWLALLSAEARREVLLEDTGTHYGELDGGRFEVYAFGERGSAWAAFGDAMAAHAGDPRWAACAGVGVWWARIKSRVTAAARRAGCAGRHGHAWSFIVSGSVEGLPRRMTVSSPQPSEPSPA